MAIINNKLEEERERETGRVKPREKERVSPRKI
jgi:hypothetical protein